MGRNGSYSWKFKLQMVQLLEKGERNPSLISRDHVTRSLLYVRWQLYQEQRSKGERPLYPLRPITVHQRQIDRAMHKNRLPIWSECVDNRPSNLIC